MQSWGTQSRFTVRDTEREPSKSGVVGLLCAALGRARSEPVSDLVALRMGVRADREGRLERDYHTAQNVLRAAGKGLKRTELSTRYYLADADFVVGLEGKDEAALTDLRDALAAPRWALYLGRKSFVPGRPLAPSISNRPLREALEAEPWLARPGREKAPGPLRLVLDSDDPTPDARCDVPVSCETREFRLRYVRVVSFDLPADRVREDDLCSSPA